MRLEKPWVCDTWLSIVQSITARKASVYMLRVIGNKSHCLRAESLLNPLVTKVMTVGTYPSQESNTTSSAASLRTRPPRWACAGKCLHRASRSSYSPSGRDGWTETLYSSPVTRGKVVLSLRNPHEKRLSKFISETMGFFFPHHTTVRTRVSGSHSALLNTTPWWS